MEGTAAWLHLLNEFVEKLPRDLLAEGWDRFSRELRWVLHLAPQTVTNARNGGAPAAEKVEWLGLVSELVEKLPLLEVQATLASLSDNMLAVVVMAAPESGVVASMAFQVLFDRYQNKAVGEATRILFAQQLPEAPAEIAAEAWYCFWHSGLRRRNFDPTQEFWKYFVTVLRNTIRNCRRGKPRGQPLAEEFDPQDLGQRRPDELAMSKEEGLRISQILQELPHDQREALSLRMNGLVLREISERLGRPMSTVDRLLRRATKHVQRRLDELGPSAA